MVCYAVINNSISYLISGKTKSPQKKGLKLIQSLEKLHKLQLF